MFFFLGISKRVLLLLLVSIRSVQADVNRILLLASFFTDNQDGGFVLFRAWSMQRKGNICQVATLSKI